MAKTLCMAALRATFNFRRCVLRLWLQCLLCLSAPGFQWRRSGQCCETYSHTLQGQMRWQGQFCYLCCDASLEVPVVEPASRQQEASGSTTFLGRAHHGGWLVGGACLTRLRFCFEQHEEGLFNEEWWCAEWHHIPGTLVSFRKSSAGMAQQASQCDYALLGERWTERKTFNSFPSLRWYLGIVLWYFGLRSYDWRRRRRHSDGNSKSPPHLLHRKLSAAKDGQSLESPGRLRSQALQAFTFDSSHSDYGQPSGGASGLQHYEGQPAKRWWATQSWPFFAQRCFGRTRCCSRLHKVGEKTMGMPSKHPGLQVVCIAQIN